ncbi:unnamed protein product [Aphanomyces euteiches]
MLWLVSVACMAAAVWGATSTPNITSPLTGCQQCEFNQKCDLAYRNTPGIFCGHWVSSGISLGCCCPTSSKCVLTNYSCNCDTNSTTAPKSSSSNSLVGGLVGAFVLVLFVTCACCVFKKACRAMCCRGQNQPVAGTVVHPQGVPVAVPVAQPVYPLQAQAYPVPTQGYPMQPQGYPMQPQGYPMQPQGYPMQPQGYPMQPKGYPMQRPGQVMAPQPVVYTQPMVYAQPQTIVYDNSNAGFVQGMVVGGILADGNHYHHHHHHDGGYDGGYVSNDFGGGYDSGGGGGDGGGGGGDCGGDF